MDRHIDIGGRKIGPGRPAFIVAEMSANHHHNLSEAKSIIKAAQDCGADAIKLQTYTADTLTLRADNEAFCIQGTLWEGETLYSLYQRAATPWDWHLQLQRLAEDLGLIFFSTPYDRTAVDFLDGLGVPAFKVASFELVDLPLIAYMAGKGKPLIMSTGLATYEEIQEAVAAARQGGAVDVVLLKCTSAYPAPPESMNLRTIPHMAETFGLPVGLSDHTLGWTAPVAAVALGACVVEKHFTLSRSRPGPDSAFSLEPHEFKAMVEAIRTTEKALGGCHYGPQEAEAASRVFRRSLFVCRAMAAGEKFTPDTVRSIRPGHGLAPKYLPQILGRRARLPIERGTPLTWDLVEEA
jgi:pseudaminic acid synthase